MRVPKKVSLKWIIISLAILIGLFVICTPIFYRINPFNRIYGNITITQNGNIIEISKDDIKFSYDFKLQNKNDSLYLSTKGDDYGIYTYTMNVDNINVDFKIQHLNSWDIISFDGNIDISTMDNTPKIDYTSLSETHQKIKYNSFNSEIIEDNSIEIYIGR